MEPAWRAAVNKNDRIDVDELSKRLRAGTLRAVYHGVPAVLDLKELVRSYNNLVEDATRVMQRIKALFRGRGIKSHGKSVYRRSDREMWLAKLNGGCRAAVRRGTHEALQRRARNSAA